MEILTIIKCHLLNTITNNIRSTITTGTILHIIMLRTYTLRMSPLLMLGQLLLMMEDTLAVIINITHHNILLLLPAT